MSNICICPSSYKYRMNSPQEWSVIERSALFLALILIIIIGLKTIEFIFNLLLISLILTLMTIPAMDWLKKRGVPAGIAVMVVTTLACLCVLALILLTFYSFQVLLSDLPMYQTDLNQRLADITTLPVSYTHLRAHETDSYLVCRLLLE